MPKVKFIADSACDISKEAEERYNIDILPITILQGDHQYKDRKDFTIEEFYQKMYEWDPLPTTSQVTPPMFLSAYRKAKEEGYDTIITVCLNSKASGTYQSACIAKEMFEDDEGSENIRLEVIDSGTYSYLIGIPLEDAAKMVEEGTDIDTAIAYMKERFQLVHAYAIVYTLDFLKRTGRVSGAAGFVGNLLDIKPILEIGDAKLFPVDKVRGKKKSVAKLISMLKENGDFDSDLNNGEVIVLYGDMPEEGEELTKKLKEEFPHLRIRSARMGSTIALHAGPKLLGVGFIPKNRG